MEEKLVKAITYLGAGSGHIGSRVGEGLIESEEAVIVPTAPVAGEDTRLDQIQKGIQSILQPPRYCPAVTEADPAFKLGKILKNQSGNPVEKSMVCMKMEVTIHKVKRQTGVLPSRELGVHFAKNQFLDGGQVDCCVDPEILRPEERPVSDGKRFAVPVACKKVNTGEESGIGRCIADGLGREWLSHHNACCIERTRLMESGDRIVDLP